MGHQFSKAMDMIGKATEENLSIVLKRSLSDLHGTSLGETIILESVLELEPENDDLRTLINSYSGSVNQLYEGQRVALINSAKMLYNPGGDKFTPIGLSEDEKEASKIIPVSTADPLDLGYRGYSSVLGKALAESSLKNNYRASGMAIEIGKLANAKLSLLDMKHIIDAQQSNETQIEQMLEMVKVLENAQLINIK